MKILIVKLSSLGDIIHALPVISLLANLPSKPVVDWLITDSLASLIETRQDLNKVHKVPRKNTQILLAKALELRKEEYDLIIDLQGLMKTAIIAKIIGAKKILGFARPRETIASLLYTHKFDVSNIPHIVDKNIELVKQFFVLEKVTVDFGIKINNADGALLIGKSLPEKFPDARHASSEQAELTEPSMMIARNEHNNADGALRAGSNNICVIPGTTWESKFWPVDHWIKLLSKFPTANIFLLGAKADLPLLETIHRQLTNSQIISNKQLTELPNFFMTMHGIIGVDTGPLHLAAATAYGQKIPYIIGIYGPTSARRTGPYGFDYLSYDEVFNSQASHKRKLSIDGHSMSKISPEAAYEVIKKHI